MDDDRTHHAGCIYIHPNAPAEMKKRLKALKRMFPDVTYVSASEIEKLTGGSAEGPAVSDYAAVIVDEDGEINLIMDEATQLPPGQVDRRRPRQQ
jgi:hypothetical protein